jgi:hypothetical protein
MSIIRSMLAVFISVGLMLAPVQAARMVHLRSDASRLETSIRSTPSTDHNCACCNLAAQCVMATCSISCPQFGQVSAAPTDFTIMGHAPFAGLSLPHLEGHGLRPPIPPPRT